MSTPVEKIKERLSIEEVVGSYIKLEKAGKNLKARCPFHNEKTASFYVSPDRGSYYCFGCGAKGDIFSFVEQFEGLDFMGALKLLSERAGIPLVFEKTETKSEKERLYAVMEESARFFEKGLISNKEALEYLKKRGLKNETIKNFRIGFVQNEWRLLYSHLKNKKYSDSDMEKAGLVKKPDEVGKGYYDRFRGRIMFPIMDSSGRVIAFSGRILNDDGKSAKYLNSPDTALYSKSHVLYGIDKAKQDIRSKNYSILVEGQMDLVLSHQAGIRNTIAVSGTALSDSLVSKDNAISNLGIVNRLSQNIIIAYDSDEAGRKAAMRSSGIALSLGMDVKIADLPLGKDPADLILSNPEDWKDSLRKAKPVVEFQIDSVEREAEERKLDPRKIPALIREKVLPFVVSIPKPMEKSYFIKMIHERFGISEDAIRDEIAKLQIEAEKAMHSSTENGTRQTTSDSGRISNVAGMSRLDMISRKLFGLLSYLDREKAPPIPPEDLRKTILNIAGSDRYNNLIKDLEPYKDELALEAELFFGINEKGSDSLPKTKKHIEELLLNFEEDIIKQDLSSAVARLASLERVKPEKAKEDVSREKLEKQKAELVKECQLLALRMGEISNRRK